MDKTANLPMPTNGVRRWEIPQDEPLHVRAKDGRRQITFEERGGHIHATTVAQAIEAVRLQSQMREATEAIYAALDRIADWLSHRSEQLERAYFLPHEGQFQFLVIQKSQKFDEQLSDDLTTLDLELANDDDYEPIRVNVLALPNCSEDTVRSFLPREGVFVYRCG